MRVVSLDDSRFKVAVVASEVLHSSWLENGPEAKLPSSSIACQRGFTLRMSDLF